MTDKEREKAYLQHIIESIDGIPRHMALLPSGMAWHDHFTVREAVLRTLQTMAESCIRLTENTRALTPNVPWDDIRNFRHILVHDYLGNINYDIITDTMSNDLPVLRIAVVQLLKESK